MPQIGDVLKGTEAGFNFANKVIWHRCEGCGKEYWVRILRGKPRSTRCVSCCQKTLESHDKHSRAIRGERHYNWKESLYS